MYVNCRKKPLTLRTNRIRFLYRRYTKNTANQVQHRFYPFFLTNLIHRLTGSLSQAYPGFASVSPVLFLLKTASNWLQHQGRPPLPLAHQMARGLEFRPNAPLPCLSLFHLEDFSSFDPPPPTCMQLNCDPLFTQWPACHWPARLTRLAVVSNGCSGRAAEHAPGHDECLHCNLCSSPPLTLHSLAHVLPSYLDCSDSRYSRAWPRCARLLPLCCSSVWLDPLLLGLASARRGQDTARCSPMGSQWHSQWCSQ